MKKIAIIMGRGIEGCGVTKFTLEQAAWFEKNGYEYTIFAAKDKSWTRSKCHDVAHIKLVKFAKPDEMAKMTEEVNKHSLVIINSLPPSSAPDLAIKHFAEFLQPGVCLPPIVLIQHDHSILSIRRNSCIKEAIDAAKVIFAHSEDNDFGKLVREQTAGGGLEAFFGDEESTEKEVFRFQPGMDFEACREAYWHDDLSDKEWNHHKWIGRTTSWKGYVQMFKLHNEFLRKQGCITTFEGIERSPAYLGFRTLSEFVPCVHIPIAEHPPLELNQPAYVFGPFVNSEMLHRMGKVAFGYQLSILDARFIRRSIEYTHCEVACTGVVPVFRADYGRRVTHRVTGNKMIQDENTGIIWLDDNDMAPAVAQMKHLVSSPEAYDRAREAAFAYLKAHQDSSDVFADMMKIIDEKV